MLHVSCCTFLLLLRQESCSIILFARPLSSTNVQAAPLIQMPWRSAIPLGWYRIGFGPPARNRKKIGRKKKVSGSQGPPPENMKKNSKKENWHKNRVLGPFSYFLAISYFFGEGPREPETYIFPIFFLFRAGGPKPILYQASGIATLEVCLEDSESQ